MSRENISDSRWIASAPGIVHRLDGQRLLFHPAGGGAGHVVTGDLLRAMDVCRAFRAFEAQAAHIEAAVPRMRGYLPAIRQTLEQLLERGLFVDARGLGARLNADAGESAFAGDPPLVIRTCDRPELLARLLNSGINYEQRIGRRLKWLILDDSKSPEGEDGGRAAVERAIKGGLRARWLGRRWQREFVEDLVAGTGVPAELLEWLLLGEGAGPLTTGRMINLALLLTAGRGFCLLDDDFEIDAVLPPGVSRAPRFGDRVPWDVYFPGDAEAARAFGEERIDDPLAAHLELCGQPLGAVLGGAHVDAWRPDAMAGCEPADWRYLNAGSRVIATVYGTRGSPASQTAHWLHHLNDETGSFSRFVAEAEGYGRRAEAQWTVQCRHQPAVLDAALTTPLTLDNRELLPCTLPAGRAEDRVLTTAIAAIYPQHVMLDYPDAWLHQREAGREHGTANHRTVEISLCDLVANYFMQARDQVLSDSPRERLAGLARTMTDLASAPEDTRFDIFREAVSLRRSTVVTELQGRIDAFEGPLNHPWLADARALVAANLDALAESDIRRFRDRDDVDSREDLVRVMGEQCGRYARALEAWPEVWEYCKSYAPLLQKAVQSPPSSEGGLGGMRAKRVP